jgi:hypothetical protein
MSEDSLDFGSSPSMEGIGYYLYVDISVVLLLIRMSRFPTWGTLIFILPSSFWIWLLDLVEICANLIMFCNVGYLCSHHQIFVSWNRLFQAICYWLPRGKLLMQGRQLSLAFNNVMTCLQD